MIAIKKKKLKKRIEKLEKEIRERNAKLNFYAIKEHELIIENEALKRRISFLEKGGDK